MSGCFEKTNSVLTFIKGDRSMKVILRVYKYKETLERECASGDEAQQIAELMAKRDPDLVVEPYIQLDDSCVMGISELGNHQTKTHRQKQG